MDVAVKLLGALMLALTAGVMLEAEPDYAAAFVGAVAPRRVDLLAALTLVGGTVGGYITFAGVHRLIEAGIGGERDLGALTRAAVLGILATGAMRVLLFLAVLGVVGHAGALDAGNPAASAFRLGAGEWGYRLFGVVLWAAAISSVVGCSYTTLSFLRAQLPWVERRATLVLGVFILGSLFAYLFLGRPVRLLVLAGALNGLILPVTLGTALVAARRVDLMGGYRHPAGLAMAGWLAWAATVVGGALSLADLRQLF
jgi:Mn2+/Fe2+ NRAMP family transporter